MRVRILILATAGMLTAACGSGNESSGPRTASADPQVPDAGVEVLAALDTQLQHSAGIRAIKRLQNAYALYVSAGEWQQAAALFAADGAAQLGDVVIAADDIPARFAEIYRDGDRHGWLNSQLIFSPVINLLGDGTRAAGRWRLVAMQGRFGEWAEWLGGIFENTYTIEAGVWKIERLHFYPIYGGSYAEGWRILEEETAGTIEPVPFHYDAERAGRPHPDASPAGAAAQQRDSRRTDLDLATLDARARQLIDEDLVTSLQNAFGYYMDRHMWNDVSELFTESGTLELETGGPHRGQAEILAALRRRGDSPLPADRIDERVQLHTIIEVAPDGLSATGRGTELRMHGTQGSDAYWGLGTFENAYVKDQGIWKIRSMRIYPRMSTRYRPGWAADASGPRSDDSAEAASEPASGAYPEFFVPELAFPHPVSGPRTAAAASVIAADVATAVAEIQRKLRVLNAYEGAENVANAYGYYIDEFLWDGMADLFSVDGWKELSYIGTYVGRERVRDSVVSRYGRGGRRANSMTFHQKTQPVITIAPDGLSASIRTRLFQINASTFDAGSYISGIYENRVVLENGTWKISAMDLDYAWLANYADGWANVAAGSSTRFAPSPDSLQGDQAPDRPLRGVTFAPYPDDEVDMAFHYTNPVSGRKPPIYLPEIY